MRRGLWARASLLEEKPQADFALGFSGVHHVAVITQDLKRSMDFYQGILGLDVNPQRPNDKLPYAGKGGIREDEEINVKIFFRASNFSSKFRPLWTVMDSKGELHGWNAGIHVPSYNHSRSSCCSRLGTPFLVFVSLIGLVSGYSPNYIPFAGAWLWIGSEMIHLMELPNPDPVEEAARPEHGGRDRHVCVAIDALDPLIEKLGR